jgi:site-specific DNA recombinase
LYRVLLESQEQKLKEVKGKIEKLEERLINDEIEPITYKKWFAKLSAEKGVLETAIGNLAKSHANIFEKLQQAIPVLTNLSNLYLKISLPGKQALLKKVFEGGLVYDGHTLRTPRLHAALAHNYNNIKEKGLLLVEQPFFNFAKVEPLYRVRDSNPYHHRERVVS